MIHPVNIRKRIRHYIEKWPITEFPEEQKKQIENDFFTILPFFVGAAEAADIASLILGWMVLPEEEALRPVAFKELSPQEWHAVSRWQCRRVPRKHPTNPDWIETDFVRRDSFPDELRILALMVKKDNEYTNANGESNPLAFCVARWEDYSISRFISALEKRKAQKEGVT